MQRIEDQSRQQVKRAEQVLSWIIFAERPLNIKELQCALAVAPGDTFLDEDALPDEDLMVSVCAGLVVVDRKKDIIGLAHYTAQQYFESIRESRFPRAQRDLFKTCTSYLLFDVFAAIPAYDNDEAVESLLEKHSLLEYASHNWGNHARKASYQDPTVNDQIREFLGRESNASCSYRIGYHRHQSPRNVPGLIIAAFFGLKEIVLDYLREGQSVNAEDPSGSSILHIAAMTEHTNVIQLLLEKGADHTLRNRDGKTALYCAAVVGRENSVRMLLSQQSNHTYEDDAAKSMIEEAACRGHSKVVQMVLLHIGDPRNRNDCAFAALRQAIFSKQEAVARMILEGCTDLEARHEHAATALGFATLNENNSLLRLLLEHADLPNRTNDHKQQVLWETAANQNEEITQQLLECGADPNGKPHGRADSIICCAMERGLGSSRSLRVIRLLLEAGADIESTDSNGWTPLLLAIKKGHTELVSLFVHKGADIAAKSPNTGRTTLQLAAIAGNVEVLHLLLKRKGGSTTDFAKWSTLTELFRAGLDDENTLSRLLSDSVCIDVNDCDFLILWHLVAGQGREAALKILLGLDVDIEAKDGHGYTALSVAAEKGHEGAVRLLLSKGANIDAESYSFSFGGTALSQAALYGRASVVRMLLDAGAKIETEHQRENGMTPLNNSTHLPVDPFGKAAKEAVVRMLLEQGASTEVARSCGANVGCTPLVKIASAFYSTSIVQLLLDKGADTEATDENGKTALYRAAEHGQMDNVRLLLKSGADPECVNLATIKSALPLRGHHRDRYNAGMRLLREAQQANSAESGVAPLAGDEILEDEAKTIKHSEKQTPPSHRDTETSFSLRLKARADIPSPGEFQT